MPAMKAVVQDRYGPPEVLRIEEVDRPVPKDDEVLIRVRASTGRPDRHPRSSRRSVPVAARPRAPPAEEADARGRAGGRGRGGRRGRERVQGRRRGVRPAVELLRRARRVHLRVRASARSRMKPAGMSFDEAAAVCDGASQALDTLRKAGVGHGRPDRHLRRVGLARHGGRAARQAFRRPRHGRLWHRPRRARPFARRRRGRRLPERRTSRRTARPTTRSSTPSASTRSVGADAP